MLAIGYRKGFVFLLFVLTSSAVAQSLPPDSVVASQGGVSVTLGDVDAFAQRIPLTQRAGFFDSPTRIEGLVTNLLTQKKLAADARKAGLDKDPLIARSVAIATDEALAAAESQRFRAAIKVPDMTGLAHDQYIAHKQDYAIPGKLTVKHVLISNKTRTEGEAQALADTVEKEAKANPGQFDALIDKYSDDTTKSTNHGLLEQVGDKGKYVAEFSKASKALTKPGEISPVVRTQFGLHVIQLVERTPDQQSSFDQVKGDLIAKLQNEYVEKTVKTHTDTIRNEPMNADPATVASLRERYAPAGLATPSTTPAPVAK